MKRTLEGLVTQTVTKNVPDSVINMEFPRLCFLQCGDRFYGQITKLFLTWPMIHTIRTLALDISYGPAYSEEHMYERGKDLFYTTPHLQHIIFVFWHQDQSVPSELVEALQSHGIKCHVSPDLKPGELMVCLNPIFIAYVVLIDILWSSGSRLQAQWAGIVDFSKSVIHGLVCLISDGFTVPKVCTYS